MKQDGRCNPLTAGLSCGVVGSSLMVRVDPAEAGSLLQKSAVRPMDFTGRPMHGFLFVDPPGITSSASLRKWVGLATAHAEAKPKKAKKKPVTALKRPRL